MKTFALRLLVALLVAVPFAATAQDKQWVVYDGKDGPAKGKHVVLISGDEEYRSEEALPMLGKLLAEHHGFKATVLFAVDPKTGEINPNHNSNIPGIEALATADLLVIATRFRDLPDDQMKYVDDYLKAAKPVIGLRTATHAFNVKAGKTYAKYSHNNKDKAYEGGFGKQVLGETWVAHHGKHKVEATRGVIPPDAQADPILRGIKDGEIFGRTDVYTVKLPLPGDSKTLVLGQVLTGMKPDDKPVEGKKNDPMMPVAWTKSYDGADGKKGRVFTTTMASSDDLTNAPLRRLLVNAAYWAVGLDDKIPAEGTKVDIVGEYNPTMYGFNGFKKGMKPADFQK